MHFKTKINSHDALPPGMGLIRKLFFKVVAKKIDHGYLIDFHFFRLEIYSGASLHGNGSQTSNRYGPH